MPPLRPPSSRSWGWKSRTGAAVEKVDAPKAVIVRGGGADRDQGTCSWAAGVKRFSAQRNGWGPRRTGARVGVKVLADCSVPGASGRSLSWEIRRAWEQGGKPLPGVAQVMRRSKRRHVGHPDCGQAEGNPPRRHSSTSTRETGHGRPQFRGHGGVRRPHYRRAVRQDAGVPLVKVHSVPGSDEQPNRDDVPVVVETPHLRQRLSRGSSSNWSFLVQDAIQATQHNGRTSGKAERPRANVSERGTVQ